MDKEPSHPYSLAIAGERIFEFIPFQKILVTSEMQAA